MGYTSVFFMDAAHCVYAPFVALVRGCTRVFGKAPCGHPRLHVLAALHATTKEIFTVQNLTYVTAETVCERRRRAGAYPAVPITIVLDKARSKVPPGAGTGPKPGHGVVIFAGVLAQAQSD